MSEVNQATNVLQAMEPVELTNLPAPQLLHALALDAEYCPLGQLRQWFIE